MTRIESDPVADVRHRARLLHARLRAGDPSAAELVQRARADARRSAPADARRSAPAGVVEGDAAARPKRRHCLATLSHLLGFSGWPHAKLVLSGDRTDDMGTLMFRETGGSMFNTWSASYEEAAEIRAGHGGFLLPYRRHFQIVEAPYVAWLELDPDHPDWALVGRDWVKPLDRGAWRRITRAAIEARLKRHPGAEAGPSSPAQRAGASWKND